MTSKTSREVYLHAPRSTAPSVNRSRFRYPPNLRWKCARCANSCRDILGRKRNILLTRKDAERIGNATKLDPRRFSVALHGTFPYERAMRKIDGRCFFLRGSKCSVYKARPLICRFYPFSLDSTQDGEMKINFDPLCSGIGKGKVRDERFFEGLVRFAKTELSNSGTIYAKRKVTG